MDSCGKPSAKTHLPLCTAQDPHDLSEVQTLGKTPIAGDDPQGKVTRVQDAL